MSWSVNIRGLPTQVKREVGDLRSWPKDDPCLERGRALILEAVQACEAKLQEPARSSLIEGFEKLRHNAVHVLARGHEDQWSEKIEITVETCRILV